MSKATIELPHSSWRTLKMHITGRLGEIFALAWLAWRRVPEGEVWGLRRGAGPVWRELSLWSPSEEPGAWRKFSSPVRLLLDAMSPLSLSLFFGLPSGFKEELRRVLSAWVPKKEELGELERLLLTLSESCGRPWPPGEGLARELKWRHPGVEAEKALAAEIMEATRIAAYSAAVNIVVTPASEFKAFLEACYAGDFILLKWRTLRKLAEAEAGVEVPMVSATARVPRRARASWIVEVMPRDAESPVFHALRRMLGGAVKLRSLKGRLYIYGAVSREELEEALERARREAQAELERRFLMKQEQKLRETLRETLGFVPSEGVAVWEGELKGVKVVEVKAGGSKLTEQQKRALERLRAEAERAREALGKPIEVSYTLLRVELEGLEVPRLASVSEEKLL